MHWILVFQMTTHGITVPTFKEYPSRRECVMIRDRVLAKHRPGNAEAACFMLDAPNGGPGR